MRYSLFILFGPLLIACNSVFYQGDNRPWRQPESINIHCNRQKITSGDSTALQTMVCPPAKAAEAVIIQFHGNAQNMYAHYQFLAWLIPEGFTLATFDYRGYGESEGESDRDGVYEDARAYIRHTRKIFGDQERVYYGQSLGGAIMTRALLDEGLQKNETYILEGTFASYRSVARSALARKWFLWILQPLAYVLVTDNRAPKDGLAAFGAHDTMLIHGERDPVVNFSHGEDLSERMAVPLWKIPGGKHLDTWHMDHGSLRPELLRRLRVILATHRRR